MSKRINILSLLLLVVYGTLTLVAVPLHQHAMNYVDTPQYHSVVVLHNADCGVCTFASHSFGTSLSTIGGIVPHAQSETSFSESTDQHHPSQFTREYPHRGPPAFLS
ncbi:MAG: hypothetical protein HYV29_09975 [Ignavibacteriales bacterium]|nr:hypothetical protein [Ignavibacteriales bacterium]